MIKTCKYIAMKLMAYFARGHSVHIEPFSPVSSLYLKTTKQHLVRLRQIRIHYKQSTAGHRDSYVCESVKSV